MRGGGGSVCAAGEGLCARRRGVVCGRRGVVCGRRGVVCAAARGCVRGGGGSVCAPAGGCVRAGRGAFLAKPHGAPAPGLYKRLTGAYLAGAGGLSEVWRVWHRHGPSVAPGRRHARQRGAAGARAGVSRAGGHVPGPRTRPRGGPRGSRAPAGMYKARERHPAAGLRATSIPHMLGPRKLRLGPGSCARSCDFGPNSWPRSLPAPARSRSCCREANRASVAPGPARHRIETAQVFAPATLPSACRLPAS